MNKINELFNGWAEKLPIDFFKGNFTVLGWDISKLFIWSVAVFVLLILVVVIAIAISFSKKKKQPVCEIPLLCEEPKQEGIINPLSDAPVKNMYIQRGLHKAVATPDYEDVLIGEDEQIKVMEEEIDLDQIIVGDMNESARAAMIDEFDFNMDIDALCDFDTVLSDEDEEDDADEDEFVPPVIKAKGKKPAIRYERSFLARLIQTTSNNKARYNVIKNVIMNHHKIRNSISWSCESFIHGRNQIARVYFIGKTLRLFLALNPADYDSNIYHQEDKRYTSKYKSVPMMIKIKSRLGLKRAISLIMDLADKYSLKKTNRMDIIDYIAANPYQPDEVLLKRNLIRKEDPNKYMIAADDATSGPTNTKEEETDRKELLKESKSKGRYEFENKKDSVYFLLYSNSGELLVRSANGYTTVQGAKRGITTFKKAVSEGEFLVDKVSDKYRFILKPQTARTVYKGVKHDKKADAEAAINKVKKFADTAIMID